jgi:hypothetical protein
MTIKEIAELCGVTEQTVLNWTHKFDGSDQKIWSDAFKKLVNAGHGIPADFTLDETLAIIGEGGGNTALASLLADNAANKNALAVFLKKTEALIGEMMKAVTDRLEEGASGWLQARRVHILRCMLANGGRIYIYPVAGKKIAKTVEMYDNVGRRIRVGLAKDTKDGALYGVVEDMARLGFGREEGTVVTRTEVDAGDLFRWQTDLLVRKEGFPGISNTGKLEAAAGSGNILEFKPLKAFGA